MHSRHELQLLLEDKIGTAYADNVYYQPPATVKMSYPAIRYERSDIRNVSADDSVYKQTHHYTITVIDKNPESAIVERVSLIPKIKYVRHYAADNLNHDVFELYY